MSDTNITRRTVEGWPLGFLADQEPRVRDLDLAERLGYADPYKVRSLIGRLIEAGKLTTVEVSATVAKTSGGRPGQEFWLTEAQALKVAAKSETDPADALLDEMIRVFMLARRGELPKGQTSLPFAEPDRRPMLAAMATAMSAAISAGDYPAVVAVSGAIFRLTSKGHTREAAPRVGRRPPVLRDAPPWAGPALLAHVLATVTALGSIPTKGKIAKAAKRQRQWTFRAIDALVASGDIVKTERGYEVAKKPAGETLQ